jgi:hypothetical protein
MRFACSTLALAACFLASGTNPCRSAAAEGDGNPNRKVSPQLEEIILVFKTHFDIGYTDMAANVVERYRTSMIDSALDVVDDSRDLPQQRRFVWTIPGWPMSKILGDWDGQTPERKQRLMAAFREGRFVVHGLPFTTHTETLSEEDLVRGLSFSTDLSRAAGLELPRDAKMTDVPCHSWIVPTLLAHAGIKFLHIGTNSGSSDPKVPLLHFREGPDGSRVLTMHVNGYGTGYTPPDDWPYKTWLGLSHTGDNHGPPRPEEVRRILDEIAERMPGVKVRIGRLSDFGDAILAKEKLDAIPVVRGDTPDTWIHGPMCDPQGRIAARRAHADLPTAESLATMLQCWSVPAANAADQPTPWQSLAKGYEQSLLYGEHTWGASLGWVGHGLPWGPDWQKQTDERHRRMVASWDEHSAYADNAVAISSSLLDRQLQRLSESIGSPHGAIAYNPLPWKRGGIAVVDGARHVVSDVPPMGYRTLGPSEVKGHSRETIYRLKGSIEEGPVGPGVLETDFFRLTYDHREGRVTSLVDKRTDRELIRRDSEGFGNLLYERFSAEQCDQFMRDYCLQFPRWVTTQFTKPGLPRDVPYCAARPGPPTRYSISQSFGEYEGVRFAFRDDPALPCEQLDFEIGLYKTLPLIEVSLRIRGKRPDTWPEAGWMCLPLAIEQPNFRLSRLGGIVDPKKDVIPGSNRHLFWLHHGLAVYGSDGYGVGICPLDAPMVSLGEPGCWRFSWDYLPEKADVFINLFDNQWNTNFRLWNEGTWQQRVLLWTFERYDPETSLIRPALEARFPLVGKRTKAEPEKRGSQPPEATGLQLSRRNVLVTSFGVDPGTQKLMLRLWEQAGKDGPCEITLPKGLAVRAAQPCDLRGRPAGDPIAVEAGRLQVDVRHNAPLNLELIRSATTGGSN